MAFFDSVSAPSTPSGTGFFASVRTPNAQQEASAYRVQQDTAENQVLQQTSRYANSPIGFAANAGKAFLAPVGEAFHAGVEQAKQGYQDAKGATSAVGELNAGMEELSGAASAVTSPLAPLFSPINKAVDSASDKISNNALIQKFANTPEGKMTAAAAGFVGNTANVVGTVVGLGKGGPKVAENIPKKGFFATVKTPEGEPIVKAPTEAAPANLAQMHQEYVKSQGIADQSPKEAPIGSRPNPSADVSTESTHPSNLVPAESTGETRTPTLSSRVDATAVANKLKDGAEGLPEYNKVNWDEQGTFGSDIVNHDPVKAEAMLNGAEPLPPHVLATSIFKALEDHATKTGDGELALRLAQSPVTSAATRMGQEIGYLSQRDDLSPVKHIQDVERANSGRATPAKVKSEVAGLRKAKNSVKPTEESWQSFVDSITCNS